MFKKAALVFTLVILASPAFADGLIQKKSSHSVAQTLDKLTAIVSEKGFNVISRVDHAAAARAAGMELAPTELLIFGNPKVGTLLMTSQRTVGLDLPIRVLAWEDTDGSVWVTYTDPATLLARYGIEDRESVLQKMTGALDAFTNAAIE